MKKAILAFATVLIIGCQKEKPISISMEGNSVEDCTLISAVAASSQTKTTADNDGVSVIWSENDALLVTSKEHNTYASIYEIVTAGTSTADFSLKSGETAQSGNLVAVYPAIGSSFEDTKLTWTIPSSQTYRQEGVATNIMAMTAQGESGSTINFAHETAVIRIPVYADEASNIVSAELSANEVIGGQWYRTVSSTTVGNTTVSDGNTVKKVALNLPDGGIAISTSSGAPLYLNFVVSGAAAAITGLTVTLTDSYGDVAVLSKASAQSVAAGYVYKFPVTKAVFHGVVSVDGGAFQTLDDAKTEILAKPDGQYVSTLVMKGRTITKANVNSFMSAIATKTSSTSGVDVDLEGLCHATAFKKAKVDETVSATAYIHSLVMPSTYSTTDNDRSNIKNVKWTKRGEDLATFYAPNATFTQTSFWGGANQGLIPNLCWIVNDTNTFLTGATMCFVGEIRVSDDCTKYCVANGILYNSTVTKLISYPGAKADDFFELPGTVTSFFNYCMGDAEYLKTIVFPNITLNLNGLNGQGSKNLSQIVFRSKTAPTGTWASPGAASFCKPGKNASSRKIYIPSDCSESEKTKYANALTVLTTSQASPNNFVWDIDDDTYTAAQLASDATITALQSNLVTP